MHPDIDDSTIDVTIAGLPHRVIVALDELRLRAGHANLAVTVRHYLASAVAVAAAAERGEVLALVPGRSVTPEMTRIKDIGSCR